MQVVSDLYKRIISGSHRIEVSLVIGEKGCLINEQNFRITFGGTAILVARSGADSGYTETNLFSVKTSNSLFTDNTINIGNAIAGEITVEMLKPKGEIPRMAQLALYVRATNGTEYSEWIQKGVYYIDTRSSSKNDDKVEVLTLHGYDAMLFADAYYSTSTLNWNAKDVDVVKEIAKAIGVEVDSRTFSLMKNNYEVSYPAQYTYREVLGYIAAMYAGSFIINEVGQLRLVSLYELPKETRYLIDNTGYVIKFGGERILV